MLLLVQVLIKANGNVNQARTMDGDTPLILTSQKGKINVVKLLLAAGAGVNQTKTRTE